MFCLAFLSVYPIGKVVPESLSVWRVSFRWRIVTTVIIMHSPVDFIVLVERIHSVFDCALCVLRDVLDVPNLVLERPAVRFHIRSSSHRFTNTPGYASSAIVKLLVHVVEVCIEANIADTVISNETAILGRPTRRVTLSLTHLILDLAFKMPRVQLCDDVRLIVFKLSLQIFDTLVIIRTSVVYLEVVS